MVRLEDLEFEVQGSIWSLRFRVRFEASCVVGFGD